MDIIPPLDKCVLMDEGTYYTSRVGGENPTILLWCNTSSICDVVKNLQIVVIYRNIPQYSHLRGVPGLSTLRIGHVHVVVAWVYRASCCVDVGRGFAMEYWLEGMFSVRTRLYNTRMRGGLWIVGVGTLIEFPYWKSMCMSSSIVIEEQTYVLCRTMPQHYA